MKIKFQIWSNNKKYKIITTTFFWFDVRVIFLDEEITIKHFQPFKLAGSNGFVAVADFQPFFTIKNLK